MRNRYIVMDRSAHMPNSCKGIYRRVAVVETNLPEGEPSMISQNANGMVRIIETWEGLNVGKTEKCAFRRALVEAEQLVAKLNAEEMAA